MNSERQMFDKERQWLSIVKHPSWLSLTLQWPFIISRQRIKFYKLLGSWLSCVKGLNFFVGNCFWTCYCRDVEMSTILILIFLNFNICLIFCDGKYIVLRSQIFNSTFKLIFTYSRHDITEILLKVALNTINTKPKWKYDISKH